MADCAPPKRRRGRPSHQQQLEPGEVTWFCESGPGGSTEPSGDVDGSSSMVAASQILLEAEEEMSLYMCEWPHYHIIRYVVLTQGRDPKW
jgi:hypothetical protein